MPKPFLLPQDFISKLLVYDSIGFNHETCRQLQGVIHMFYIYTYMKCWEPVITMEGLNGSLEQELPHTKLNT